MNSEISRIVLISSSSAEILDSAIVPLIKYNVPVTVLAVDSGEFQCSSQPSVEYRRFSSIKDMQTLLAGGNFGCFAVLFENEVFGAARPLVPVSKSFAILRYSSFQFQKGFKCSEPSQMTEFKDFASKAVRGYSAEVEQRVFSVGEAPNIYTLPCGSFAIRSTSNTADDIIHNLTFDPLVLERRTERRISDVLGEFSWQYSNFVDVACRYWRERRFDEALQALQSAQDTTSDPTFACCLAGWISLESSRRELIENAYKRQPLLSSPTCEARLVAAAMARALGRSEEAIKFLNSVIAEVPNFTEAWFLHGRIMANINDRKKAFLSFSRALEIDPFHINAALDLSEIYLVEGNVSGAKSLLDRALAFPEVQSRAYLQLGLLRKLSGDVEGELAALEQFCREERADPGHASEPGRIARLSAVEEQCARMRNASGTGSGS